MSKNDGFLSVAGLFAGLFALACIFRPGMGHFIGKCFLSALEKTLNRSRKNPD
jgi:hypothetical protein